MTLLARVLVVALVVAVGWPGAVDRSVANLIGSPIASVSQTGATTGPVHDDPYGVPRPGSASPTGFGFAGEWKDPSGLLNLRARAYDPVVGRFVGRDTFGGVASAPRRQPDRGPSAP